MSNEFRVVLFTEGGKWVAQGLEHDICAVADTLDDLYSRFEVTVRIESSREGGLEAIEAAPKHFFKMWDRQSGAYQPASARQENEFSFALAA